VIYWESINFSDPDRQEYRMDNTTSTENTVPAAGQPAPGGSVESTHRQVYGTAKTENLRDSGLWRILLPGFILVACLAMLALPLIILIPLFLKSLDPSSAANVLHIPETWIWIVVFLVEMSIVALIVRSLVRVFLVRDGHYR
jgi:hypothetical protein